MGAHSAADGVADDKVAEIAYEITPAPGGIDPEIDVALVHNVILAAERLAAPEYYVSLFNKATNNVVTLYPVSFGGAVKALAQLFGVSEADFNSTWNWPDTACLS
jgi:hypothetical protein